MPRREDRPSGRAFCVISRSCLPQGFGILGIHQNGGVARHFRQCGNGWKSVSGVSSRHGFPAPHAEPLIERGKGENRAWAYQEAKSCGERSREGKCGPGRAGGNARQDFAPPNNPNEPARTSLQERVDVSKRLHQARDVLALLDGADVQDDLPASRPDSPRTRTRGGPPRSIQTRTPVFMGKSRRGKPGISTGVAG